MLDSMLCFRLRSQRNESDIGDDVNGFTADLSNLLTLRDGDEVRRRCEV
jgi:hypothetical protein